MAANEVNFWRRVRPPDRNQTYWIIAALLIAMLGGGIGWFLAPSTMDIEQLEQVEKTKSLTVTVAMPTKPCPLVKATPKAKRKGSQQ